MNNRLLQSFWKRNCVTVNIVRRNHTSGSQNFQAIDEHNMQYEGHRSITWFQKSVLAIGSAITGLYNPHRSDMVSTLGETLFPESALRRMQLQMLKDETGCQILEDKPFINSSKLDVAELSNYPQNTLGYAYAKFMKGYGINSDTRDPVHYIDNAELAFIMSRYRQIHDFVHVLLDCPITVPGEIIVKWFELMHFGLPMTAVAALFGPLATTSEEKKEIQKLIPWAIYAGRNSKPLINVYFEKELDSDLEEIKTKLNIVNSPFKIIS